jgi:hypothetical protein
MARYIPDDIMKEFQRKYETGDIWQVHTGDTWLTFFLYSNDQIEHNKTLPIYEQIRNEYFDLLVKYRYNLVCQADDITIYFDSKENFETKYRGNWQFYYT